MPRDPVARHAQRHVRRRAGQLREGRSDHLFLCQGLPVDGTSGGGPAHQNGQSYQIYIAGLVQALAEGLHFAKRAGLDPGAAVEIISKGAAQSWHMDTRHETMSAGKFDFGFAVNWMRKDLALCLGEARRNGATLPVATLVNQFYAEIQTMGRARWDLSSLIARLERS